MIYYLIGAIFPLVAWAINYHAQNKYEFDEAQSVKLKNRLTLFAIFPMFLLFVLRYKYVGPDTIGYVRFFENEVRQYSFSQLLNQDLMRTEIGYRLYVKIISLFTTNYTIYHLINGIVIFGTLFHFAKKHTDNPFIFFFLFMTLGMYSFVETGLRQALAMMTCLWAVDFVKNRKPIRFVLLVIIAQFFHKSALIFLIAYPLSLIKKFDWMFIVYAIIAVALAIAFGAFQGLFNSLLGYEYQIEETGNGGIFMILVFIFFVFSTFMVHDKPKEIKENNLIIHLSFLTVLFWILRLVSRTAERVGLYFNLGLYAYFSQMFKHGKDELFGTIKWLLILVCLVLFIYRNLGASYLFFWQGA